MGRGATLLLSRAVSASVGIARGGRAEDSRLDALAPSRSTNPARRPLPRGRALHDYARPRRAGQSPRSPRAVRKFAETFEEGTRRRASRRDAEGLQGADR